MSDAPRGPTPDHPIEVSPLARLARAVASDGRIVAASTAALLLEEADLSPVIYFPADAVDPSVLEPTATKTHCPYKGDASYDAVLGRPDKAWRYYDPHPDVAAIAGHIAFYPDAATVEIQALPPVPEDAERILGFWFGEVHPEKHFARDDALDRAIADRFGALHAAADDLEGWEENPRGGLALLVLLDQFSRNLHRGSPAAFANDPRALATAEDMVARGFDLALPPNERAFVYLPFMHSERIEDQNACVALYEDRLPGAMNLAFALEHREEIHRHGRFLGRDAALDR